MKKVINITLGGIVFAIEEDAYTALSKYLEAVKQNLSKNDDYTEISEDIEGAIAEKFVARKRNEKSAVSTTDVAEVTKEMGTPSDFGEGTTEDSEEESENETEHIKKRFYRDTDDEVLAGVASGIAKYFDIDPVIIRLVFVISTLFNGFGVLAYIILWIVVPPAETTAQKFAMRGEKVTIKEITDQVKKNLESLEKADFTQAKGLWAKLRRTLVKLFEVLGSIVRFLGKVFRFIIGFPLLLAGAFGIAGLVSVFSILLLSENIFLPQEVYAGLMLISNNPLGVVSLTSLFVAVFIPLLVLILIGSSLLRKNNRFSLTKSILLGVLWFTSLTLLVTTAILQAKYVVTELEAQGYDHGGYNIYINESPFAIRVSKKYSENDTPVLNSEHTGFSNTMLAEALSTYLVTQKDFSWKTNEDSHTFCSIQNLDTEETLLPVYVWAYCAEYKLDDKELQVLSGTSGPVKVSYPNELSYFDITKFTHIAPRDGAAYTSDVKKLFPKHIQETIAHFDSTDIVKQGDAYALKNIRAWEEIQRAISICRVESVFQTHNRKVTVELKNGDTLFAIEPKIDNILTLAVDATDTCGSIIMATE